MTNKLKLDIIFNIYSQLGSVVVILFLLFAATNVYAVELNEKDYYINNFGIKNGKPFITVQGTAGGSFDPSMGDEGYEAYVFDTDRGIFQISVAQGPSNDGKPYYSEYQILSNGIKSGTCLLTEKTDDNPLFNGNTVEFTNSNLTFTKVNKVYSILVTSDDPDEGCSTGEHISKIYSLLTKPALSVD